ncbi:VCBS repeat-containing protein [Sediminibacterium sp. WSJ-3]|nr:VCBS repeat-containing protein [Sediminibacterium soli]
MRNCTGIKSVVWILLGGWALVTLSSCKQTPGGPVLFEVLKEDRTGIAFNNKLTPTQDFNMFKYMYFYNGSGVGAGDFNNDGLVDLFFASNQGENKLYLNTGSLHFRDVTAEARVVQDGSWSTGVSVVDINNDGLLDLYICRVGKYETLKGHNLLLLCTGINKNGVPQYEERSQAYGIDFAGFSTQAAFLDYDRDGDLDMFLLNHSVHQNGSFAERSHFLGTYNELSGDRLYRNDGAHFTDVTKASAINSSAISYGLGVVVADINLDGYPDIYVGNDFHENDYLYINRRNGTFRDESTERLMHTSQFSMGVDIADVNNDGFPDITSMDMLPSDPYILKRSEGEDAYDIFNMKISYGYHYQYTRNNLQLNRRNGMFSETGLYSGMAATDWSWASLWMDFDNDGRKDLFISNGIPKRMNDIDYINFVSDGEIQSKIRSNSLAQTDMALIDKFPQIKIPNKFYRNSGNMVFTDMGAHIAGDIPTYSNGAVYADLDNDGDLDIVVNNIDEPVLVYANKSNDDRSKAYAEIRLKGDAKNINATGAKVLLFTADSIRSYEKTPVRGFLSSMETSLHIGLDQTRIDSSFLVWPDNTYEVIRFKPGQSAYTFTYRKGLPLFDFNRIVSFRPNNTRRMEDIAAQTGLLFRHTENEFNEFNREPLLPHMVSTEGPALAVGDINKDGLEDVFIGGAKETRRGVWLQQASGKFTSLRQPALEKDSVYEDVDACWADINKDGYPDLLVASGGNEYYGREEYLQPRAYLNDGKGNLVKLAHAFDDIFMTASCISATDFNGDGYVDLFIGSRAVPFAYGQAPVSRLLQNDGSGKFRDVTALYAPAIKDAGMVTGSVWTDIDKDGDPDLLLCREWGGIDAFINTRGTFSRQVLTDKKGWWNFLLPVDIDNDGDLDLVAGNLGLNSRLKASAQQPVRLYYDDFDGNGKKEQVLTYYLNGKELPFANKAELEKQMPVLKKKYLYAEDFAKAGLTDILSRDQLGKAQQYSADYFSNAILINNGNLSFTVQALPWEAQLSSFRDAATIDANGDGLTDILLGGNYYGNNIQMGRYDADYGTLLVNKGKAGFAVQTINGVSVKGQVRKIRPIKIGKKAAWVLARNNDTAVLLRFADK